MKPVYLYIFIVLMIFTISCKETGSGVTVFLKKAGSKNFIIDSSKVRIVFSDSMNVDAVFVNRKIRRIVQDSNNVYLEMELSSGEHKLFIQKKDRSIVNALINVKTGDIYLASYGVVKETVDTVKSGQDKNERPKTFWDIVGKIAGIVFAVILVIFYGIVPLINFLADKKELVILIIVAIAVLAGLGILYGGFRIIYSDWTPYSTLFFIFVPGLYAVIIGAIGASDTGYRKDTSHEWRFMTSGGKAGGRYKDATVSDVYEHYHGRGSWEKKIKNRKTSSFIIGIIIGAIIANMINGGSHVNLFYNSFGFFAALFLGLVNYIIVCLSYWDRKGKSKGVLFFSLFNIIGCVITIMIK